MSDLVQSTRHGRVVVISIQREAKRNAVNQDVADGIDTALRELDDDPDLWVGVLTGTLTVFSGGQRPHGAGRRHRRRG